MHALDHYTGAEIYPEGHPWRYCEHCGEDFEGDSLWSDDTPTFYCIVLGEREWSEGNADDLHAGIRGCCLEMELSINLNGYGSSYEDCFGFTPEQALGVFTGRPVRRAWQDAENCVVVFTLDTLDPTAGAESVDQHGRRSASSPPGWQRQVFAAVDEHHRHHPAPRGHKFSVAVENGPTRVGVAVVGRPVSRVIQAAEPLTLEVTRVCIWGNRALTRNATSKVYAAAAKRAKALGYTKLITYTLADEESGVSLLASGYTPTHRSPGGSWNCATRPRTDKAPTGAKIRWEKGLTKFTRRDILLRQLPALERQKETR